MCTSFQTTATTAEADEVEREASGERDERPANDREVNAISGRDVVISMLVRCGRDRPPIAVPGVHACGAYSTGTLTTPLELPPMTTLPRGTGPRMSPNLLIDASHWKNPWTPCLQATRSRVVWSIVPTCGGRAVDGGDEIPGSGTSCCASGTRRADRRRVPEGRGWRCCSGAAEQRASRAAARRPAKAR